MTGHGKSKGFIYDTLCKALALFKSGISIINHLDTRVDLHHTIKERVIESIMVGKVDGVVLLHLSIEVVEFIDEG